MRTGQSGETCARGPWQQTVSGGAFYPGDPRPSEVFLRDIAHGLSHVCRFSGQCLRFYSVGEHCVRVSQLLERWGHDRLTCLTGLLHDASEAYLVDLPKPVKILLPEYVRIEQGVERAVQERFGIVLLPIPAEVKRADQVLLATERRFLMPAPPMPWSETAEPDDYEVILPWSPQEARWRFVARFSELEGKELDAA